MLILEDMIRHQKFRKISTVKDRLQMQVIASSEHIKLNKLSCLLTSYEWFHMKTTELSTKLKTWRHAVSIMKHTKIDDLVNCLTVFIRENWNKTDDLRKSDTQANIQKNDSVWAEKYFIALSTFLITWKRIDKDADDLEKLKKKYVRCSSNWQNQDYWRQDHVWMQKHQDEQHQAIMLRSLNEKILNHLNLIVTVLNHKRLNSNKSSVYTEILIKRLRKRHQELSHEIHDMIEMKNWSINLIRNSRKLKAHQFYWLTNVIWSAHVMLINENMSIYYVNNYIDWDQYNTLYDEDFLKKRRQKMNELDKIR